MSLTIDTLLKSQGEVHLQNINIKWYFTPHSDEEIAMDIEGTYNIDSYYDSRTTEIHKPRTLITGYYEIFNKLQFTDINENSAFILSINHITEYQLSENTLTIEFVFHRSLPQIPFGLEQPIIAGAAEIESSEENVMILQSLIHKNLHLHFADHVFKIPRCNRCSSALTVHTNVDLEDEVINEDFICMDCYSVINNFYNLLEKEVYKITDPGQMKMQRDNLVKFVITGKKNASQIEETQLQHFYNLLIIYIEYLSGNLGTADVLQKIKAVQTISENKNFPLLKQETYKLMSLLELEEEPLVPVSVPPSATVEPQPQPELEPELAPPPLPLGTPSPSTIVPQDPVISEGLQSLEEVQAELQSTLEALNQIESDLNPRPISPTDKMHAINTVLDEEPDHIPTFEDIKETFSDLESLDFPDLRFGIDSAEQNEITEEVPPKFETESAYDQPESDSTPVLNPPPSLTHDYEEEIPPEPDYHLPTEEDLPHYEVPQTQPDYDEIEVTDTSSSAPESELDPAWRTTPPPTVTPPPAMNPPPQVTPPPTLTPPPAMNPPPQATPPPVVTPPPAMNPPPQVTPPPTEPIPEPEPEIPQEPPKPMIQPKPTFFNNGPTLKNNIGQIQQSKTQKAPEPKVRPKDKRAKRDRKSKHRKIFCSFCGVSLPQSAKECSNCGSKVKK